MELLWLSACEGSNPSSRIIEMKKIKTNYGTIEYFKTKEAGFNIETVKPKKGFKCYLKRSVGILYVLEGKAKFNKGLLKKGDLTKFKPREKIIINNVYNKPFKFIGVDIPPAKKGDIVWLK